MKILITCDPEIPVPPVQYGGIERIVDSLITAFKKRGHNVYLCGHPCSSSVDASAIYGWPALHSRGTNNILKNSLFLRDVYLKIKPDIIHSFSRLLYLYPLFTIKNLRVLQSYQRGISANSTSIASKIAGNRLHFSCCGGHMINKHPIAKRCATIYNFTDVNYFQPEHQKKTDYLVYLGRIEDIKGTKEAIEVALSTNQRLVIAGNIQPGHEEYFNNHIKPHLNNPLINYVGPVNDEQKRDLLQGAKAFLFPIKWEEPFGIVMAEAMACGVPVIGFNRGSVPEVVENGRSGYVVNTMEEMCEAVNNIHLIDRHVVRKECEQRFSLNVVADQYLNQFENLIKK